MADRKSIAITIGVAAGIAAVATTIAIYTARHREAPARDVNEVFDAARETVRKLQDALDVLHKRSESA